jgi:hypothetical protein
MTVPSLMSSHPLVRTSLNHSSESRSLAFQDPGSLQSLPPNDFVYEVPSFGDQYLCDLRAYHSFDDYPPGVPPSQYRTMGYDHAGVYRMQDLWPVISITDNPTYQNISNTTPQGPGLLFGDDQSRAGIFSGQPQVVTSPAQPSHESSN